MLSTGGMLDRARDDEGRLSAGCDRNRHAAPARRANPSVKWVPVNENAECVYMKMTTRDILLNCLREGTTEVVIEPEVARRARRAVDAMIAVGAPSMVGE